MPHWDLQKMMNVCIYTQCITKFRDVNDGKITAVEVTHVEGLQG